MPLTPEEVEHVALLAHPLEARGQQLMLLEGQPQRLARNSLLQPEALPSPREPDYPWRVGISELRQPH